MDNSATATRCYCTDFLVPRQLTKDEGFLRSQIDLPITGFTLSGTDFVDFQYQYHTVGPFRCYQCKTRFNGYCIVCLDILTNNHESMLHSM